MLWYNPRTLTLADRIFYFLICLELLFLNSLAVRCNDIAEQWCDILGDVSRDISKRILINLKFLFYWVNSFNVFCIPKISCNLIFNIHILCCEFFLKSLKLERNFFLIFYLRNVFAERFGAKAESEFKLIIYQKTFEYLFNLIYYFI